MTSRLLDEDDQILARDNLILAFFGRAPFVDLVGGSLSCFERWLQLVPPDALKWSIVGETEEFHKRLTKQVLQRCRSMLKADVARKKNVMFRIMGEQKYGPDYRFVVQGYKQPVKRRFLNQTSLVEMRFPAELLEELGHDEFAELGADLFASMPCDSGYGSVSLCYGSQANYDEAATFITPKALRHHGLDVSNNSATAAFMGAKMRGARWLTMLSDDLVGNLGGPSSVMNALDKNVEIVNCGSGMMLRAGKRPETGDVDRGESTPLLRSVALAVEEITYFGDNSLLPVFNDDREKRDRWERRFW